MIVERGLQAMSQEAGKMLDMVEAVEYLFAEYLARRPLDEQGLVNYWRRCMPRDS